MPTVYPIVPGHEIVGRVIKVGSAVTKFKPGDLAAVGCLVDSDGTCAECWAGLEQFCPNLVLTFNSPDKHLGGVTYGGYFEHRRRPEVRPARPLKPEPRWSRTSPLCWNHDLLADAPLGRHQGQESWRGRTRGPRPHGCEVCTCARAHVVVFTTSPNKKEDARRLGADEVVISKNADEMQKHADSFDFIIDTVSADHDINAYINLLRRDGNLTIVGAPPKPLAVAAFSLIMRRRNFSGSSIGGIAQTQEMLDFCGKHNITADVEVIPIQKVNEAYERLLKSDVKYRFSIDMASLKSE